MISLSKASNSNNSGWKAEVSLAAYKIDFISSAEG
jgi:hypothetical protein